MGERGIFVRLRLKSEREGRGEKCGGGGGERERERESTSQSTERCAREGERERPVGKIVIRNRGKGVSHGVS